MPIDSEPMQLDIQTLQDDKSRRTFLTTLLGTAAAATALSASPVSAFASTGRMAHHAASIPKTDAAILNFALTLEHLEARFYADAVSHFGMYDTYLRRLMHDIKSDEDAHVKALTAVLTGAGYKPVAALRKYHFGKAFKSRHTLLKFSGELETTGVHAYLGQAPNLKSKEILLTAASIVTVEARHTGAIMAMMAKDPSEGPFDKGYSKDQIVKIITPIIS